jgi:DNA-binding transcriptional LysR family regulator
MDIDQLTAFERVVREGSFSKAAWSLGIAQPTVSTRIRALEREVGGPLFHRGRRVRLTERGVGFLPYARRVLSTLQDGLEAARLASTGERGRLSIGVLRSMAGSFLGPALAEFGRQYPEVECYVREGEGDHWRLVEMLVDSVVELAMVCWPVINPLLADMIPVLHAREPLVLVAPKAHVLARQSQVTKEELLAHADPFLLLRWWQDTPIHIAQLAAQTRKVADVPMDTGRFLLRSGKGAGFFTKMVILPDLEAGHVMELKIADISPMYRDTALVHLSRHTVLSAPASNFIRFLKIEAQKKGILLEG